MGKRAAVLHTKSYYFAFCAVGEAALGAALWFWTVSSSEIREDRFGLDMPGVSWGELLVTAMVVAALTGALIALTRPVPRVLRWAVGLISAVAAGALAPVALLLTVRPSPAGLLVAMAIVGMAVSGTGMVRAAFRAKPGS
ncbi:hypothetical protein ACFVW8_26655 [Streptomyces sp. NPDC058221]|uniref:hypothetical protein n=1 Tax=Streptomyces sp. NPDC058221 TaxID=3346388 RepID=UPI0036DFA775